MSFRSKRNSGRCKTTPTLEIPDSTPAGHERYAMVDMPPAASPSLQDLYQQGNGSSKLLQSTTTICKTVLTVYSVWIHDLVSRS